MTRRWVIDPSQLNEDTGTPGKLVPAEDYVPTNSRLPGGPVSDLYMDGTRAVDGTDIGSRKKRREYMHVHGLADADDFKGTWEKASKEREQFYREDGHFDEAQRKQDAIRALHTLKGRR